MGKSFEKMATGITGLDDILNSGIPKAQPTLVCGGSGRGKTLLAKWEKKNSCNFDFK